MTGPRHSSRRRRLARGALGAYRRGLAAGRRRSPALPRPERGAVELELVIVVPVLMMIVLFVVWAGRVGNAGLAVELAAEEAAVAAALSHPDEREQVVAAIVEQRADLDYFCIGGPAPVQDGYVSEVQRDFVNSAGVSRGVGLVGVALRCETDGAVPVLRGLAPTVVQYGRGTEPFFIAGRAELPTVEVRDIVVVEGPASAENEYQEELITRSVLIEIALDRPVIGEPVEIIAETQDIPASDGVPQAAGGESIGGGGCEVAADGPHFFDYRNTTASRIIPVGEQRVSFPVLIIDDCIDENDERFKVLLRANGALLPGDQDLDEATFEVTIRDNDPTPLIGFSTTLQPRPPGHRSQQYCVEVGGTMPNRTATVLLKEKLRDGCQEVELKIELRHPLDTSKRVLSGRPISFDIESRDRQEGGGSAADENNPHTDDCDSADFDRYGEMKRTLKAATPTETESLGSEFLEFLKEPHQEAVEDFSLLETKWQPSINNDEHDESEWERFVLIITGAVNAKIQDTAIEQEDPGGEDEVLFGPSVGLAIIDDDDPPDVSPDLRVMGNSISETPYTTTFGNFNTDSFTLRGSAIILSTSPTPNSQASLNVTPDVEFTFRDDPDTTADDPDTVKVDLPSFDLRPFRIDRCMQNSDSIDLKDLAQRVAAAEGRELSDLAEIVYSLNQNQPSAAPTTGWGSDPLFTVDPKELRIMLSEAP